MQITTVWQWRTVHRMKNIVQNYESRKSPEVCEFWVEEQDHKEAVSSICPKAGVG